MDHSCAVVQSGVLKCWGDNDAGQLGTGATSDLSLTPVTVAGLTNVVMADGGDDFTCARVPGAVKCWGTNTQDQVGALCGNPCLNPVSVFNLGAGNFSLGQFHGCAGGKCWGGNGFGQLGLGVTGGSEAAAFDVCASGQYTGGCVRLEGVGSVGVGHHHSCAVMAADGGVKCWGRNDNAQLGNNTTSNSPNPVNVCASEGINSTLLTVMTADVGGEKHSCALAIGGGSVMCWGFNGNGQLGHSTGCALSLCPAASVAGLSGTVTALTAGARHTCALISDGTVQCWGNNASGQLGDGQACGTSCQTPVTVSGLSGVTAISAFADHTCAVVAGGGVRCWGTNGSGQLGNGSTTGSNVPVSVVGFGS
jgi:alpha-tubulin suppressor-like RCC1 family protein